MAMCNVSGCGRPVKAKGYCARCYKREVEYPKRGKGGRPELSPFTVRGIKRAVQMGDLWTSEIAQEFGVAPHTVSRIKAKMRAAGEYIPGPDELYLTAKAYGPPLSTYGRGNSRAHE
jgi:hypothetical protein